VEPTETSVLRDELDTVASEARAYFERATVECDLAFLSPSPFSHFVDPNHFWDELSSDTKEEATELIARLLRCAAPIGQAAGSSPLTGGEDVREVKEATKSMRAALRLRRYSYREADAIHDEGTVLGFRPAEQSDNFGVDPETAQKLFNEGADKIRDVLSLIDVGAGFAPGVLPTGLVVAPNRYRAGTAFIMMWMDTQHPELTDVADAVKSVFGLFGIDAVRADDIQHEGLITDRILSEIQTSEFLFADLTGARPNVYYEVGYAHALGKRVILFRKEGTGLHFDLAGYNCPSYKNLRDLREQLEKRLVALTNRNPLDERVDEI
jgi:hypothetical protein